MDRGAWRAAVYGAAKSWTCNTFHFLFCRGQQNALLADWKGLNKSPEFLLSAESKNLLSLDPFLPAGVLTGQLEHPSPSR